MIQTSYAFSYLAKPWRSIEKLGGFHRLPGLFLLVLLFNISACANLGPIASNGFVKEPVVDLVDFGVSNFSLQGITFSAQLEVDNPNSFGLSVNSYQYNLALQGHSGISGDNEEGFHVAAASKQMITIPVTVKFAEVLQLTKKLGKDTALAYDLDLTLNLKAPVISNLPYRVKRSGRINIPQLPNLGFN